MNTITKFYYSLSVHATYSKPPQKILNILYIVYTTTYDTSARTSLRPIPPVRSLGVTRNRSPVVTVYQRTSSRIYRNCTAQHRIAHVNSVAPRPDVWVWHSSIAILFCMIHEITYQAQYIPASHIIRFVVRSDQLLRSNMADSPLGRRGPFYYLFISQTSLQPINRALKPPQHGAS